MHHKIKAGKLTRKQANRSLTHIGVLKSGKKKRSESKRKLPNTNPKTADSNNARNPS